jgi:hypothetical protein
LLAVGAAAFDAKAKRRWKRRDFEMGIGRWTKWWD